MKLQVGDVLRIDNNDQIPVSNQYIEASWLAFQVLASIFMCLISLYLFCRLILWFLLPVKKMVCATSRQLNWMGESYSYKLIKLPFTWENRVQMVKIFINDLLVKLLYLFVFPSTPFYRHLTNMKPLIVKS